MSNFKTLRGLALLGATSLAAPALAQQTNENATRQADDAFGISVGSETIGLYNNSDVRNFSPEEAGNIRIDGLYFDRQTSLTERIVGATIIRVGINTLGYTFPAPSGVVDYQLRGSPQKNSVSVVAGLEGFVTPTLKADAGLNLAGGKVTVNGGFGWQPRLHDYRGGDGKLFNLGIIPRWRPNDDVEVTAFYDHESQQLEVAPLYLSAGPTPIPKLKRGKFFGQHWAKTRTSNDNAGLLGKARLSDSLSVKAGLFRSSYKPRSDAYDLYLDVQPDGSAERLIYLLPPQHARSWSGEAQAEYRLALGRTRHIITAVARGRNSRKRYGGEVPFAFGPDRIDVARDLPRPDPVFEPQNTDRVTQRTLGLLYRLQWASKLDVTAGVQKSRYRKSVTFGSGGGSDVASSPLLFNGLAAWRFGAKTVAYASYSRGLEESGVAPPSATNRGEVLPPIRTKQRELGIKTQLGPMTVIATAFELEKPYASRRSDGRYDFVGTIRNRGVETSLTGQPVQGLQVVLGAVFLDPRVLGEQVELGLVGKRSITFTGFALQGAVDYQLPFVKGLSIDAQVGSFAKRTARRDNFADIPPRTLFNLGTRYRFNLAGKPSNLRFQVLNLFNNYGAVVGSGEQQTYNIQRRFRLLLSTDF